MSSPMTLRSHGGRIRLLARRPARVDRRLTAAATTAAVVAGLALTAVPASADSAGTDRSHWNVEPGYTPYQDDGPWNVEPGYTPYQDDGSWNVEQGI
jgi:hypothetical protein